MQQQKLRNIAIIAHVDHGKTTLVDAMLKQTKTFAAHQKENEATTILDSNELERERGVTILAKNTAVFWHDYKINILDTPGHADFSGEVERVLHMADGCVLLVDAAEGVLSQTKFVLRLALELGLVPIVMINKVDRKDQRAHEVEGEIADLFLDLATRDDQLSFPILYAKGIDGIVGRSVEQNPDYSLKITDSSDLTPLFETIIETIPEPSGEIDKPFQMQVSSLDWDDHIGKIVIGKVNQGILKKGQRVSQLRFQGQEQSATITYLFTHKGLGKVAVDQAEANDIIAIAGLKDPHIGYTICDPNFKEILPNLHISEPTVKMRMSVNTSPFAGREAEFSTSRQLRDRLNRELETNVSLRVMPSDSGDSVQLVGRGELHLSILIETMRREGYEFALSRPQVVLKKTDEGTLEPWDEVTIEVPEKYTGFITSAMAQRRALLQNMHTTKSGVRFEYQIATANLIGFRSELLSSSSGEGVLHASFLEYRPLSEHTSHNRGGAIIAHETGMATAYALDKAQQRGTLFVGPGTEVYAGQVVGIHNRSEDVTINIVKGKKLTNMRAASADATVVLTPPWKPSLEQFLTLVGPDELLEVTPAALRLRYVPKQKFQR